MTKWMRQVSVGLGVAALVFAFVGSALASSKLPTVCVQAQNAYKKSSSYVRTTIRSHKTFRNAWKLAFNHRKVSKKMYTRSSKQFTSSKSSYSSLKSYLASKGFNVSRTNSLKKLLSNMGYKISGKNWLKNKLKVTSKFKGVNPSFKTKPNKKVNLPFSASRVKSTTRTLTRTKVSLKVTLKSLLLTIKRLKAAKAAGLKAKAQSKTARSLLANTKSLVRRCNSILKSTKYRNLRRKKYRVERSLPRGRGYCGGDDKVSWSEGFYYCAPCDPMRSSCNGTCQYMSFGMMEQNTSNQDSQLTAAEGSSDPNGNIMFEIDMKTTETTNEANSTQSSTKQTDDALGALGF
ncbi:MAG: hypothetical protein EP343_28330 [Deltaproteobacteria bacterium]|nr:MAG: hypothetical protein EP343_28330 [Deltaproteobacteria bacterium]